MCAEALATDQLNFYTPVGGEYVGHHRVDHEKKVTPPTSRSRPTRQACILPVPAAASRPPPRTSRSLDGGLNFASGARTEFHLQKHSYWSHRPVARGRGMYSIASSAIAGGEATRFT